jgi:hypothetical protein
MALPMCKQDRESMDSSVTYLFYWLLTNFLFSTVSLVLYRKICVGNATRKPLIEFAISTGKHETNDPSNFCVSFGRIYSPFTWFLGGFDRLFLQALRGAQVCKYYPLFCESFLHDPLVI